MEVSSYGYGTQEQRLLARLPCNSAGSSPLCTASSKSPEPPRNTSHLSPKPAPKKFVSDDRRCAVSLRNTRLASEPARVDLDPRGSDDAVLRKLCFPCAIV